MNNLFFSPNIYSFDGRWGKKRVEIQPEGNEGAALADAHGAVGKTKLVRLPLAFIEFTIKSYVITESKRF